MRRLTVLVLLAALLVSVASAHADARASLPGSWLRSEDMLAVRITGRHGERFAGSLPVAQPSAKLGCRYPRGFGLLSLRFRYVEREGSRVRVPRAYTGVLRDFPAGAPGCETVDWRVTARISPHLDALTVAQAGAPSGFVFHFVRRRA